MSPLQTFAKEVTEARKEFEAARGRTGWASRWLIFKDAKDAAYEKLVAVIPKVKKSETSGATSGTCQRQRGCRSSSAS
jgi:hypothetical protein